MIKRTGKVIAIFLLLMMTVLPASCSMVEDSSLMKGSPEKISVEKGWTVKFDYTLHASWDSECEEPHLVLEGAEPTDGEFSEDCYYYDLRVRNAGTEDYDWAQARIDNETLLTPVPNFYAVARDADGNITGMGWMPEDDDSKTPSVIPAGETVTVKVVTNTDYGDNIEFMLEW